MAIAQVRPATPDDAPAVTAVQREVWTTAWAGFLPTGLTEGFDDDAVSAAWARTAAGPGLWVATEGAAVAGFCLAGPAAAEDVADAVGAVPDDAGRIGLVATLLVSPRWGRRGHGGRLLVAAADGLRSAGAARAITWVPERDAASRAFYRRAGWEPDGTVRTLDAGGRPLREVRLGGALDLEFAPEPTADDLGLPLL
jgi:GNAT superfamily N-acetyltransferase